MENKEQMKRALEFMHQWSSSILLLYQHQHQEQE